MSNKTWSTCPASTWHTRPRTSSKPWIRRWGEISNFAFRAPSGRDSGWNRINLNPWISERGCLLTQPPFPQNQWSVYVNFARHSSTVLFSELLTESTTTTGSGTWSMGCISPRGEGAGEGACRPRSGPRPSRLYESPQGLVDRVVDFVHDHQTLRACSLTCKALLYSTRRFIHSKLYMTPRARKFFPQERTLSHMIWNRNSAPLYFLSYMHKRGLLQYVQRVYICLPRTFTPENLLPHLHHFQTLNRVHTLTIKHYDAFRWAKHYRACFAHFYPTLTSLSLWYPSGHFPSLFQFALQFPNLEYLSMCLKNEERIPTIHGQSPPPDQHFRLSCVYPVEQCPADLSNEQQNKMTFRSVELERPSRSHARQILDACADTLENLTIVHHELGVC